jgi:transglutaminase-like putative cysteine protease
MMLDGQKRYFRYAGQNLFRIDKECSIIKNGPASGDPSAGEETTEERHINQIMDDVNSSGNHIVQPKRLRITYTLSVKPDMVPAGEMVRCWLPYPRTDHPRQRDVKLISTSLPEYKIAPEKYSHTTLYKEQPAVAGQPTVFSETFEYTICGEWHKIDPEKIEPYNTNSKEYKKYTSEREKHIVFTPEMRALAAKLTEGETNPYLKAKKIFTWINENFPWASAREYSTIENIPEYVVENGHGDCGQVTLLFVTLCRICGIPAHFQSGFVVHPDWWNLHDWGQVYFEPYGWVPVDQSFGIRDYADSEAERDYFLGGVDSWRMIVNSDYGMPLYPKKIYPRSETVDFQRGEVEWSGGNLYFPTWNYSMEMQLLEE